MAITYRENILLLSRIQVRSSMAACPYLFFVEDLRRTTLDGIHGLTITPENRRGHSLEQTTRADTYALETAMARIRLLSALVCAAAGEPRTLHA